uniref:Uncharacterized protein MANES_15G137700 n=1 Tax=Rhizophora mucronata TaxID=61149 RepID=A0A2P2KSF1_RHIMU
MKILGCGMNPRRAKWKLSEGIYEIGFFLSVHVGGG